MTILQKTILYVLEELIVIPLTCSKALVLYPPTCSKDLMGTPLIFFRVQVMNLVEWKKWKLSYEIY